MSSAISADRLFLSFLATISRAPQRLSTTSCTLRKIRQATLSVSISRLFVWANYEIAGNTELNVYDTVGANEIAAITLNKIGAPLTDYQKALLATRSDVPTINVAGYIGADGLRYDLESEDSPYASTIDKLQRMQYLEFASKVQ